VYIGFRPTHCQLEMTSLTAPTKAQLDPLLARFRPFLEAAFRVCCAALRPYSCAVLGGFDFEGWNCERGSLPPCFDQLTWPLWPSLTGHGSAGIVTTVIQRPAGGIWCGLVAARPPSIKGAGDGELGSITAKRCISIEANRDRRARQ